MTNLYDEAVDAWKQNTPKPSSASGVSPYDTAVNEIVNERQQRTRAIFEKALETNPDQAAEAQKLAKTTGLPVDIVERNQEEVRRKQQARMLNLARMAQDSPILARQLVDPSFTKQAHDDINNLTNVERTFMGTLGDVGTAALKGAVGLPQALVGLADIPTMGYAGKGLQALGVDFKRTQDILSGGEGETLLSYSAAQQAANQRVADADGFTETLSTMLENPSAIATMVGESLPQMLGGAAIGRAALSLGARAVGAGMVGPNLPGLMARQFGEKTAALLASAFGEGAIAAGYAAEQFRGENADGLIGAKETLASLGTGAGTALFGFAGGFGARKLGITDIDTALVSRGLNAEAAETLKKGFVSSIVRSGISEGLFEELPQSIQEQVWQNWANDRPLGQGVGKAAAQGALAGFAMGGGFQAIGRVRDHYSEINTAQSRSQQLLDAINAATPSALRERNPEQFRTVVQAMADNAEGAPSEVYIDAEVLNQLAPEVLAQLPQSVRDQIPDALAANDVVSISTGDVLTIAPGTPLEQVLVENGRVGDPRAMTQIEANQAAEKAQEFLAQQAQQVIQQAADQQSVQQSHDVVKQTLLDRLNAVGRDRPAVNKNTATLYASLYTTLAGELGITPEAAFGLYGVNIVGQTGQGATLGQSAQLDTPEFKNWFGESKVVDASGKPLRVFHGTTFRDISTFLPDGGDPVAGAKSLELFRKAKEGNEKFGYMNFRSGSFFSPDPAYAGNYTNENKGVIYPVYIKAENPVYMDQKTGKVTGTDPNKTPDALIMHEDGKINEVSVLEPTQIKSATGNRGTFDPNDPNILNQDAGELIAQHNLTAGNLLHAMKMGGIAVPSLAVTKKDTPLTGFGEITLVAPSEMVDPQGYAASKVFGADIYSPRYPQITYELTPVKLKALKAQFAAGEKATGATIQLDELEKRGADELINSAAVMWQFLTEQGEVPDVKTEEGMHPARLQRLKDFGFEKFFGNSDYQSLMRDEEFQRLVIAEQNDAYTEGGAPDLAVDFEDAKVNDFSRLMALSRKPAYEMSKAGEQAKPDGYATRDALRAQIRGKLDEAFNDYATAKFEALGAKEKIFQGVTNSGNRKYTPHTLENVVKILKKELRGGEGFNYGVGSLRAKFTPQFKTIAQIRKAKDRLMDKAAFEAVKEEVDNELIGISDALDLTLDQTIEVLEDAPKMGVNRALERAFKDYKRGEGEASDATKERIAQYLTRLKNLPTEYFEAKILRDVDLAEFKGAVVPEGVDPKVIEALTSRGVTDIRTYKAGDEADRAAKIGEFGHLFFQQARGTFNPATFELALNENSNMSTVHHEMAHAYLEIITKIASGPNAPQGIVDQVDRFLKWQGIPDLATWNMMTLNQKRPHHEAMAENYEHYLITGKAPSVELQPLFRNFKRYMLDAYKSLKSFFEQNPGVDKKLPPEMVQFYDRMLASEEQIAQANEVAGLLPDPDADAEAIEKLTARSLRDLKWAVNARNKEIKQLQDQAKELRKEIEEQVTAEVNEMPEFQAKAALDKLRESTPEYKEALKLWTEQRAAALTAAAEQIKADLLAANPDVKGLKKAQLLAKNKRVMDNQAEAKVLEWEAQNPKPRKAGNVTDADLAVVADSFGYSTVEGMLQAIDAIGKKSDVIAGMTDQRMLEEHGDLIDQRAIEQAANEAVHNEARARSLATELKSQGDMLNARTDTGRTNAKGSKITVNAIVEAAKQFAANVVGRTQIKDLQGKARQHTAAERRAGKRWQDHTANGETADAVKAKQDQVLNNAAAKAAMDAQVEMRKMLEFFKRVVKDGNEKTVEKGRDPDVVNAARAVLAAYGVAPKAGKTALEYMALVEKNDPAMHAALQPSVQGALNMAQPLDALTMEELRGLHEEIQAMWHLAKRSRQMEVDGNMLDLDDAEAELQDRMQEIGVPDTMPGDSGAMTSREELVRKLQSAGSILRRVEQWSDNMGSEFTKLVFQPIKNAADRYRTDRVKYRKAYQALVDAVAPSLRKGEIAAPELGYTFGKGHNGIGHAELLHAILHTGNESNKRKLLLGRNWATENAERTLDTSKWDAFIERMQSEGLLTKAHYDFAQGVWDLLEQTKPLAQKTHRDVFGRYFAEVTADSFDTPFGSYRGGYVPAQADPRIVQDADLRKLAEAENENMAFAFPSTNKGFTEGRVEYNRPLMLDLRTIGQHIDKVLLFSHMEPAVRDVQKLLSRKGVSYSLGRIDPTAYAGMLTPWLSRSARQVVETPTVGDGGISRVMAAARARAGMALMFANVSNAIQQLTGFSLAAIKVKPASMMRATAQFIASPKQTAKAVSDASPFMANRMENEISAINDAMDAILLDPSLYEKSLAWTQKHAYFLQTAIANSMEPIIWTAAYNDALTEGQSEKDAVRHADSVVRTTQGSTLPEDVSRIETGPAWARLFTQFIGYFNMMANTNATALQQVARETGLRKGAGKALGIITLGMLAPIWVAEAIALAMRGGPDDEDDDGYLDDWLAAVFGMGTIKGSLAMVPFVGQAAQLTLNRFNDNPADDKFSLSPAVSLIESTVSAPASVYKAITDNGNRQKAVRDVATAVSVVTGLPAFAIARPLGYLAGVEQGKIEPTSAADMARGLVTGTASPASR